jgi:hypothetical protein
MMRTRKRRRISQVQRSCDSGRRESARRSRSDTTKFVRGSWALRQEARRQELSLHQLRISEEAGEGKRGEGSFGSSRVSDPPLDQEPRSCSTHLIHRNQEFLYKNVMAKAYGQDNLRPRKMIRSFEHQKVQTGVVEEGLGLHREGPKRVDFLV